MKRTQWIWCAQQDRADYNLTAHFKKEFEVGAVEQAVLRITADSWYRVSLNGTWINDGPGKAYPEHYTYDVHNVSSLLKKGTNRIDVIARYFGVGTFHQIPQQAGLWAELELDGKRLGTDATWQAAPSHAWQQWAPKISNQMEAVEEYDARLEKIIDWQPAVEFPRAGKLVPRNTGLLTKIPRRLKTVHSATVVRRAGPHWCVAPMRLAYESLISANFYTSHPIILRSILTVRKKQQFNFASEHWKVAVNGRLLKSGKVTLDCGQHTVQFFCANLFFFPKTLAFPFRDLPFATWGAWSVHVLEKLLYRGDDMIWFWFKNKKAIALEKRWQGEIKKSSRASSD